MSVSYEMLVLDIDGTLIGSDGVLSEANRRAIAMLKEQGVPIVLATGRTWGGTRALWEGLGLTHPVILCNGAQVYDPVRDRFLYDRRLTFDEVRRVETFLAPDPSVDLYAVVSAIQMWVHRPEGRGSYMAFDGDHYVEVPDVFRRLVETDTRPVKFLAITEPAAVGNLVPRLRSEGGLNAVQSEPYAFDILPPAVSKGSALAALLSHMGVSPRRVVAVGNAPNDLDMLKVAGLGVAVGDAHAEVIAAADRVTVPCKDGAVAEVVQEVFGGSAVEGRSSR